MDKERLDEIILLGSQGMKVVMRGCYVSELRQASHRISQELSIRSNDIVLIVGFTGKMRCLRYLHILARMRPSLLA